MSVTGTESGSVPEGFIIKWNLGTDDAPNPVYVVCTPAAVISQAMVSDLLGANGIDEYIRANMVPAAPIREGSIEGAGRLFMGVGPVRTVSGGGYIIVGTNSPAPPPPGE